MGKLADEFKKLFRVQANEIEADGEGAELIEPLAADENKLCDAKGEETVDEMQELKAQLTQALADLQAAKDENAALVQAKAEVEQTLAEKEIAQAEALAALESEKETLAQAVETEKQNVLVANRRFALGSDPGEENMKVIASMSEEAFALYQKATTQKPSFDRQHLEQEKDTETEGLILG